MESSMLFMLLFISLLLLFALARSRSLDTTVLSKYHERERSALLEFQATFYNVSCNYQDLHVIVDGKNLTTWRVEGKARDHCDWEGVECDEHSGYVIGLDLSGSCLSGSINSSSSIFQLVHLETLNLSYNDFHYSQIPSAISNLSRLTSLELIGSNFSGQIPSEILHFTNLSLLDVSYNELTLVNPSLKDLVQTIVKLEHLNLNRVNISSSIPDSIPRQPSLKFLGLSGCGLQGHIPPSIANFIALEILDLAENHLVGQIPCLQNLTNLQSLLLSKNYLVGDVSFSSFWNLTQLDVLDLSFNEFTGEIFPQQLTSTKLSLVDLSCNKFYGQIPRTISLLKNLWKLYLNSNYFSGKIYVDLFYELEDLDTLDLSFNNFSLIVEPTFKSRQRFLILSLVSCNLTVFPKFLRDQDTLEYIDLSSNSISGEVPEWFLNVSTRLLTYLNLSHNHLIGFEGNLPLFKWEQLEAMDLRFNQIKGSLPSLSASTESCLYYLVSNNKFSGEIPTRMCNLTYLKILDLGNNNLSGKIPSCLTDLVSAGNLLQLSLQSNNFSGQIPQLGKDICNLVMIDMSYNQLEGPVPREIKNCMNLEFLNLRNNRINDVFPFWLGKLPALSILMLDSNEFHGIIEKSEGDYRFPKLQIICLSRNKFTGSLPSQYFVDWSAMKVDADKEGTLRYLGLSYWETTISQITYANQNPDHGRFYYSFKMVNKGVQMEYNRILESFIVIDLSRNNFTGEIPESIGTLKGLHLLNLSSNMLTGPIPSNLNGLTNLESLDLSRNKLSSKIPQQLTDLTSLSSFDVSFNQLIGPIPLSKQFNTFENKSYRGNIGLCGPPLSKKCGNTTVALPLPSLEKDDASSSWIEIDWKIVVMGYTSGFIIGVTLGMNWTRGWKKMKRSRQIKFIFN